MRLRFWRAGGVAFLLAALAMGCGGEPKVDVYPVTGKLTRGGKPLAGVMVTFTPISADAPGVSSSGLTNDNGEFVLVAQSGKAGAIAGMHKVQLTVPDKSATGGGNWADPSFRDKMMKERNASTSSGSSGAPVAAEKSELVPPEYADGTNTPLKYEVKPTTNAFDIPIP